MPPRRFAILRCDHGWLDTEADLDLVHEYLDPAAQLVDPLGSTEGRVLHLVQLLQQVVEIGQIPGPGAEASSWFTECRVAHGTATRAAHHPKVQLENFVLMS